MQKTLDWNIIYKEHSPKLLGVCRRYVSDLGTAEDLLQDSFLKAFENQHQLKFENALFSWLKKIVINNALQYLRKNKDFNFSEISTEYSEIQENIEESGFLSHQFSREEMLASLDLLPSHHKAVFNLFFLENYSHAEIAEQLGININTSKSHLLRAKKTIKAILMNNNQPSNSFKKRGIQLLVFLGFGNLLWAKSFQNNFADFTIKPRKDFQPENSLNQYKETFSIANSSVKKSNTKWAIALLLIFSIIFMVWNSNIIYSKKILNSKEISTENIQAKSDEKPIISNSVLKENSTENSTKIISDQGENFSDIEVQKTIITKSEPLEVKENSTIIPVIKKEIISKNEENQNTIKTVANKDSVKIVQKKKVIVVKKIIKRDTIYIKN